MGVSCWLTKGRWMWGMMPTTVHFGTNQLQQVIVIQRFTLSRNDQFDLTCCTNQTSVRLLGCEWTHKSTSSLRDQIISLNVEYKIPSSFHWSGISNLIFFITLYLIFQWLLKNFQQKFLSGFKWPCKDQHYNPWLLNHTQWFESHFFPQVFNHNSE